MLEKLKQVNLKKIGLQTLFGGIAVYVGAKQSGIPESQAILAGVISALTSTVAAGTDTRSTPPAAPAPGAGE